LVRLARFQDSVEDQEIKMATNTCRRKAKTFAENYGSRGAVLQD
jgi:hypothetical protein